MRIEMLIKYITLLLWAKVVYSHNIDPVLGGLRSLCFIQASASALKSHFISHSHVLKSESITMNFLNLKTFPQLLTNRILIAL